MGINRTIVLQLADCTVKSGHNLPIDVNVDINYGLELP